MKFLSYLPTVKRPVERRLSFNVKLKWTLIILIAFFILSNIPLYGLTENALQRFEYLSLVLGARFGSLMSLGIGPIVTASIILQLLVGSKLLNIDLTKKEGRKLFEGLQKLLAILFCFFEATIFVLMKGLQAQAGLEWLVILQLFLGGLLVIYMDEVVSKWGFGSGVSLFILAGVAESLFVRTFGFVGPSFQAGNETLRFSFQPSGAVPVLVRSIIEQDIAGAKVVIGSLIATIVVFLIVVYTQGIKVEIPLSFARLRGLSLRWPLEFFYTNVIPVILISALLANIQLGASLLEKTGKIDAESLAPWLSGPGGKDGLLGMILKANSFAIGIRPYLQALFYLLVMIAGSALFAYLWMRTSGMDPKSQAEQIMASELHIPGFRKDQRVIETILNRYIPVLTILGGAAVGFLAAFADLGGALVRGTGLLLAVMIVYRLYQEISREHALDMHPALRKFIG